MPHGRPDWYNITPMIQVHASEDVNELAARLGSVDVWDRRGNVVFIDDFSHGVLPYDASYSGAGSSIRLEAYYTATGTPSLVLDPGPNEGDYAYVGLRAPTAGSKVIGFEAAINPLTSDASANLRLQQYDGTRHYEYVVRIDKDDGSLSYKSDSGSYVTLSSGAIWPNLVNYFHRLKVVVDLGSHEYVRCLLNDEAHSLVGEGGYDVEATSYSDLRFRCYAGYEQARGGAVVIDYIVVTINEN